MLWEQRRQVEEEYTDQGLPVQALVDLSCKIVRTAVQLVDELHKSRNSEEMQQKLMMELFGECGYKIDRVVPNCDVQAEPLLPSQVLRKTKSGRQEQAKPKEEENPYRDLDPTDRLFMVSFMEKLMAEARLGVAATRSTSAA
jgi:hypothetical protein